MLQNPILVVDDDQDDMDLIIEALGSLNLQNQVLCFKNGDALKAYLEDGSETPSLILCDLNLGSESGFEVRRKLIKDKAIRYKSVPFIFWSTHASEKQIQEAYDLPAQGFFVKSSSFKDLCDTLKLILEYWTQSLHPKPVK